MKSFFLALLLLQQQVTYPPQGSGGGGGSAVYQQVVSDRFTSIADNVTTDVLRVSLSNPGWVTLEFHATCLRESAGPILQVTTGALRVSAVRPGPFFVGIGSSGFGNSASATQSGTLAATLGILGDAADSFALRVTCDTSLVDTATVFDVLWTVRVLNSAGTVTVAPL